VFEARSCRAFPQEGNGCFGRDYDIRSRRKRLIHRAFMGINVRPGYGLNEKNGGQFMV